MGGRARYRRRLVTALTAAVALTVAGLGTSHAAPDRAELEAARERLHELEREFEIVVEDYNLANLKLEAIQKKIAAADALVSRLDSERSASQEEAVAIAVQLYKGGGMTASLETVLASRSLAEMDTNLAYLETSQETQTEIFERLAADSARLKDGLEILDERKAEAASALERVVSLKAEIEEKIAAQQGEITELNEKIERAEARSRRQAASEQATAITVVTDIPTVKASNPDAQEAVDAALSQLGKPYVYAADGPDTYDCSGLTMWAWAHAGVSLPHNSGMQYAGTPRVARADLEPGDLLFFGSPIHHVAMYVGGGRMVEAPYTGQVVRVVSMDRSDYVGAGRPGV